MPLVGGPEDGSSLQGRAKSKLSIAEAGSSVAQRPREGRGCPLLRFRPTSMSVSVCRIDHVRDVFKTDERTSPSSFRNGAVSRASPGAAGAGRGGAIAAPTPQLPPGPRLPAPALPGGPLPSGVLDGCAPQPAEVAIRQRAMGPFSEQLA